jgi:subtilisin family serine protease
MNTYRSYNSKAGMLVLGLVLIGVLLFAGSPTSYATPPAPPASDANPSAVTYGGSAGPDAAGLALPTDQVIVKYRAPITQLKTFNPASTAAMDRLSEAAGVPLTYEREMSGDAQVLGLPARLPLAEVQAIADSLSALPEVEYAEPDAIMVPMLTPNDPQYPNQWHYLAPGPSQYGINAPAAWDVTTGSPSIVVADIDTGITNHVDLSGRTLPGYDFISDSRTANDGDGRDSNPSDPGDWITAAESSSGYFAGCQIDNSTWHGTHTAGTIGAASNNGVGVAGVNWNSKILPVRVLGKCGGYISDIADGMRWSAGLAVSGVPNNANPAKVINMSLSGAGACGTTYQDAINAITGAGTTIVVAAGNNNPGQDASGYRPGNCTGIITVAATNRDGARASYSNFGASVEISAPGGETKVSVVNGVLSTLNTGTQGPGTDAYAYYQGTSMAAPHVAGVASLLYSLKPALTPAEVLAILQNTVTNFPTGSSCTTSNCGRGIVNAGAAVAAVLNPVPTITGLNPSSAIPGGSGFTIAVNGTGFVHNSAVQWNGSNRTTTYISSTQLTAVITGVDIATAGTGNVTVLNPAPGGGASNTVSFVVGNPLPAITGLNPFWATPGGLDFTLIVNGTGFINSSLVQWNGLSRVTTYFSSTKVTAAITAADIAATSTASVTVVNPSPGGGASNTVSFLVGTPKKVYLPLVVKNSQLPPAAPVLNAIANADGDGNYSVSWNAVAGATSYTLEEDDNAGFTSPTPQYNGAGTSWNATGKAAATYYYRVKAGNNTGSSGWSNVQPIAVCQNAIQNSGFENGAAGWQEYSFHGWPVIVDATTYPGSAPAHSGSWEAWEGGDDNDVSFVQQTVVVSCPYLVYWHWIHSDDTCGNDFGGVLVNGNKVDQYDLCVSTTTPNWAKHVVNLSAYVGQMVQLQIRTETNGSIFSNLFLDDLSLQPTTAAAAAVSHAPSAADWQMKSVQTGPRRSAVVTGLPERVFRRPLSSGK